MNTFKITIALLVALLAFTLPSSVSAAGGVHCGAGATGGAGTNALFNSNVFQQILGGGSGSGGSLLCITGSSCPADSYGAGLLNGDASSILSLLNGGSGQITNQVINLAGQTVGTQLLDALGIGSSGAGNVVQNVLGQSGGSGGFSGLTRGLLGGGGTVPVNDAVVRDNSAVIRQIQTNFETKEFCTDNIAYELAQQAHGQWVGNTVDFANRQAIGSWRDFSKTVNENIFKSFVDNQIEDPAVKELLIRTYQDSTTSKVAQTRIPPEGTSAIDAFRSTFVDETTPTVLSEYSDALDEYNRLKNVSWEGVIQAIDSYEKSQVVCIGEGGTETEGTIESCPTNFRVVTHATLINEQLNQAVSAGPNRLAEVDEATKNVNQFMVQLFQQAFTNIGGLLSLSDRGSSSGGAGTGTTQGGTASYLDRLSGSVTDTSESATKSLLTESIGSSIEIEESYQDVLADMVADLRRAAAAFDAVTQCYLDLSQGISVNISSATALARSEQASSTVAAIFTPQINRRVAEIAQSELVVSEMVKILSRAEDATTAAEINAASDSFDGLLSAGLVHTEADIVFLNNDRSAAAIALSALSDEAFNQLSECRSL